MQNTTTQEQKKQIQQLFKTYKSLIRRYKSTANFKEPIMQLVRTGNTVEFYEKINEGLYEFTHTNGKTHRILINKKHQLSFDYGDKSFRGYICHEDHATPYPENPLLTTELLTILIEKTLSDIRKWQVAEINAISNKWWTIGAAIALIIVAITFYVMLKPEHAPQTIQATTPLIQTAAENITQTATIFK